MAILSKERIWPTLIVVALLANVALGFVLIRVAGSDAHFAVEPDYYRKAIGWDSTMAQGSRNAELGWRVVPRLGAVTPDAPTTLVLEVRSADDHPVAGADVVVEAIPVAFASQRVRATLAAQPTAGQYAAGLLMPHTGLWELRIEIRCGSERFTTDLRLDASAVGQATLVTERPGEARP